MEALSITGQEGPLIIIIHVIINFLNVLNLGGPNFGGKVVEALSALLTLLVPNTASLGIAYRPNEYC